MVLSAEPLALSMDQLEQICLGMTMEEVINKIGYPDANVGSGIVVHRYETEDGIEFFISYMNETDAQMRVVNIYYGGS